MATYEGKPVTVVQAPLGEDTVQIRREDGTRLWVPAHTLNAPEPEPEQNGEFPVSGVTVVGDPETVIEQE